jgi:hypothetical protein
MTARSRFLDSNDVLKVLNMSGRFKFLNWSLASVIWVFLTALGLSYMPQIKWIMRPEFSASIYEGLGFQDRILKLFYWWDSRVYISIAEKGYVHSGYNWDQAFFPGWVLVARILGGIVNLISGQNWNDPWHEPRVLVLILAFINVFLLGVGYYFWAQVLRPIVSEKVEKDFRVLFFFYPCTVFFCTSYPEVCFIAMTGLSCYSISKEGHAWNLIWALPVLMSLKHAGIATALAFPLWSLWTRRLKLGAYLGYILGAVIILGFYSYRFGDPFAWLKAQAAWGRTFSSPLALVQSLQGKGVELVLYVLILFAAPVWLFRKLEIPLSSFSSLTKNKTWGLFFLVTCSIFVPLWFGSSTTSIYRVILLGLPSLLMIATWTAGLKSQWTRQFLLFLLLALNVHATYRFIMGLYLP